MGWEMSNGSVNIDRSPRGAPSQLPRAALPGFCSERRDPVSGTYHLGNGYRAYSPNLMRFTCPDSLSPFGAGGVNPYAYCAGDPINRLDPSGHISMHAWMAIGMGVMGLVAVTFAAGMAIAAAGGVLAAIQSASALWLVVGASRVVSDVTSIASGALEDINPTASTALGWASLASGLVELPLSMVGAVRKIRKTIPKAVARRNIEIPHAGSHGRFSEHGDFAATAGAGATRSIAAPHTELASISQLDDIPAVHGPKKSTPLSIATGSRTSAMREKFARRADPLRPSGGLHDVLDRLPDYERPAAASAMWSARTLDSSRRRFSDSALQIAISARDILSKANAPNARLFPDSFLRPISLRSINWVDRSVGEAYLASDVTHL